MQRRKLGANGPEVGAIGLGCMGMSDFYGPADRAESIATIHAALDSGATLIDTGDFYGSGHNELLISEALKGRRREDYVLSVKFGALRDPAGGFIGYDARPAAVKNFLAYTLKRLGVDAIDIYRPARLDPAVPIEHDRRDRRYGQGRHVRAIDSEVGASTIRRAAAVHPIADLQIEYRSSCAHDRRRRSCRLPRARIGITAYGVLARGLISGHWTKDRGPGDFRSFSSRFAGDDLDHPQGARPRGSAIRHRRWRISTARSADNPARSGSACLSHPWASSQGLIGKRAKFILGHLRSSRHSFSRMRARGCAPFSSPGLPYPIHTS